MNDLHAALIAYHANDSMAFALIGDALDDMGHPKAAEWRRLQAMLASPNTVRRFFAKPALQLLVKEIEEGAQSADAHLVDLSF